MFSFGTLVWAIFPFLSTGDLKPAHHNWFPHSQPPLWRNTNFSQTRWYMNNISFLRNLTVLEIRPQTFWCTASSLKMVTLLHKTQIQRVINFKISIDHFLSLTVMRGMSGIACMVCYNLLQPLSTTYIVWKPGNISKYNVETHRFNIFNTIKLLFWVQSSIFPLPV